MGSSSSIVFFQFLLDGISYKLPLLLGYFFSQGVSASQLVPLMPLQSLGPDHGFYAASLCFASGWMTFKWEVLKIR